MQVFPEVRNLLDQRKQLRIHCLLVCLALLRQLVLLQKTQNKNIRTLNSQQTPRSKAAGESVLPPSLCQRFPPPGAWASSASSSWSKNRSAFWGPWRQRCPPWCLWRCRTSGELYAEALGSQPEDLRETRAGNQLFTPSNWKKKNSTVELLNTGRGSDIARFCFSATWNRGSYNLITVILEWLVI